jgi:hypothetical protein
MGLAQDPIVKYRFQMVYLQNLENIGVRDCLGGGAKGLTFRIKELQLTKSRKI